MKTTKKICFIYLNFISRSFLPPRCVLLSCVNSWTLRVFFQEIFYYFHVEYFEGENSRAKKFPTLQWELTSIWIKSGRHQARKGFREGLNIDDYIAQNIYSNISIIFSINKKKPSTNFSSSNIYIKHANYSSKQFFCCWRNCCLPSAFILFFLVSLLNQLRLTIANIFSPRSFL